MRAYRQCFRCQPQRENKGGHRRVQSGVLRTDLSCVHAGKKGILNCQVSSEDRNAADVWRLPLGSGKSAQVRCKAQRTHAIPSLEDVIVHPVRRSFGWSALRARCLSGINRCNIVSKADRATGAAEKNPGKDTGKDGNLGFWATVAIEKSGAPGVTRTRDPQFRKLLLYPTELQAHKDLRVFQFAA